MFKNKTLVLTLIVNASMFYLTRMILSVLLKMNSLSIFIEYERLPQIYNFLCYNI